MLGNTVRNKPYPQFLKSCLTNWLYDDHELVPVSPQGLMTPDQFGTLAAHGMHLAKQNTLDPHERSGGYPYLLLHNHFKYGLSSELHISYPLSFRCKPSERNNSLRGLPSSPSIGLVMSR